MTNISIPGDPTFCTSIDSISLSACFLDLLGVGNTPRHATGFFWRRNNDIYLITNWHVVTGKNIFDGSFMCNGWYPQRMICNYFAPRPSKSESGRLSGEWVAIDIELEFLDPPWLQHQEIYTHNIDVIAVKLDSAIVPLGPSCVNDFQRASLLHFAGRDVFILGHPIPRKHTNWPVMFPIWKRGSLATELIIPWNMRPAFLVDSRTTPGMSGSAVFAKDFGPTYFGPQPKFEIGNVVSSEFMGIYSGRITEDDRLATLGIVWHRHLIDQIIDAQARGTHDWSPSKLDNIWADFMAMKKSEE